MAKEVPNESSSAGKEIWPPLTFKRIQEIFEEIDRNQAHRELPFDRLEIAQSTHFRLARTQRDMQIFRDIESELTTWRRIVEEGEESTEERDESGLTVKQRLGLHKFSQEGGHISPLTTDQQAYLLEHGVIVIIEVPISIPGKTDQTVRLPVGTVSALKPTPHTPLQRRFGSKKNATISSAGKEEYIDELPPPHRIFPNFDPVTLYLPRELIEEAITFAPLSFTDVRSSIRGPLSTERLQNEVVGRELLQELGGALPPEWEGWNPRNMGYAAYGKLMTLAATHTPEKSMFTFNIGTVKSTNTAHTLGVNLPSISHNRYARPLAWRTYADVIIPNRIKMFWQAYEARVGDVMDWSIRLLQHKGYQTSQIRDDVDKLRKTMNLIMSSGHHAPLT